MLAVRLPNELEDRLSNLEILYSSEQRLVNIGMSKEKILTSEEFWGDCL